MKTKDIITITICIIITLVSVYFGYGLLFPQGGNKEKAESQQVNVNKVPTEFDEKTYKTIESLSDYGVADLTGIGKTDLFGN